jgi:hypothetical protein
MRDYRLDIIRLWQNKVDANGSKYKYYTTYPHNHFNGFIFNSLEELISCFNTANKTNLSYKDIEKLLLLL